jgi:hypothetical protein
LPFTPAYAISNLDNPRDIGMSLPVSA